MPVKRTILVTGVSSGIGRAIARQLLTQGHHVVGTSRDISKFNIARENFTPLALDLNDLAQLPNKMRTVEQSFPELDAVVFNAGFGQFGSLEEFSYAQIEKLLAANFTAQVFITKALLPKLKRKQCGDLIYIGSEAALQGSRQGSIYCASKFALRGFTQALRDECGKSGLRVCLINPGMVKTPFFEGLKFEPGLQSNQHLLPEDVADMVVMVLNSSPHFNIDEINLSPLTKVVKFK